MYHDTWSRLTLSAFYQDLEENSITPSQFARWLLDRSSISMAVLKAATRVNETLKDAGHSELPLLRVAKENARFLYEYTLKHGLDLDSQFRLSHAAKRLVELIEASTAPDAPFEVAMTGIWAYMLSSWTGWTLCKERGRRIPKHFDVIASYLVREGAINGLVCTQNRLDRMLASETSPADVEKASKTFEEVAKRTCAVLDNTLHMGEGNHVPLCICGRKGHLPSQCTFKSHI